MAQAPSHHAEIEGHLTPAARVPIQHPPVSPGKVAVWLFLGTEIMFFTGLIGTYIVLRAGSPEAGYSSLYAPGTVLRPFHDALGARVVSTGPDAKRVEEILNTTGGLKPETARRLAQEPGQGNTGGMSPDRAKALVAALNSVGARAETVPLRVLKWPQPYDDATNPLSIDLTAVNTFVLICSSVTMVLALSAVQRGEKRRLSLYLLATVLIGSTFLGVQVYEYRQLLFGHHYPIGVSPTGHFTPDVSLFASTFFTMTGFHGAHVAGGVVALTILLVRSLFGAYNRDNYSAVELVGLYWHFVDLVWILLFTVVYLI